MIQKTRGFANDRRPSFKVDPNAAWSAGMVAFLKEDANGDVVATTAALASATVPIGTFWKDKNLGYYRTTLESGTFDANDQIAVKKGNIRTGELKVTSSDGTTEYVLNTDYTVANGVITIKNGGAISAGETVTIWYGYTVSADAIMYEGGTNYDRVPDDTLGSGQVAILEGMSHVFTDQFDVSQSYNLNDALRSNADSKWTTAAGPNAVCGKVIKVPTVDDPWLGIAQIPVAS